MITKKPIHTFPPIGILWFDSAFPISYTTPRSWIAISKRLYGLYRTLHQNALHQNALHQNALHQNAGTRKNSMRHVTAAVLVKERTVLLARRKPGGSLGGKWEFPGGKLEAGETPEQGLERELREELGIEVLVGDYIGSVDFQNGPNDYKLLAFVVTLLSGQIIPHEHEEIKWVPAGELDHFDLADSDRSLLPHIQRHLSLQ